jgi:hypothetical protein
MVANLSLKLENPTVSITDWHIKAAQWQQLNNDMGVDSSLSALAIKALYVMGLIYNICESVSHLLSKKDFARQVAYIPAYGMYATCN